MVWALLIGIILVIVILVGMYNSLVRLKVQTDNAWADIDVQLKRRYDLIPNLVETVKGYAGHEKGTLEAVINPRNRAMTATSPGDKAQAENMLSGALKSLFALSETYPQLRAIESFTYETIRLSYGAIDVFESIQAHFIGGPGPGLYRPAPVKYVPPQGLNSSLFLDVKRVVEVRGRALKYETSRERHYRKLKSYVPDADNSTQNISIEYSVSDALRFFEDHDELYWNVTGDGWDIPIQSASAHIILPEGTTNIRANVFTGAYRSRAQNADVDIAGNGVEVRTREPLRLHEGLTVAVAFDKGFVHEPTAASKVVLSFRSNWPLGIPIAAFAVTFYLWWTRGRDPRLRPISAQYEPRDQLTPGAVRTLVDNSADMRDIRVSIGVLVGGGSQGI